MHGLFRYRQPDGKVDVRVKADAGGIQKHVSEKEYVAAGLAPPFDQLPWSSDPNVFAEAADA